MIMQTRTLLAVLATVACADGNLLQRWPAVPTTNFGDRHHPHTRIATATTPTIDGNPQRPTPSYSPNIRYHIRLPITETTTPPTDRMKSPKSVDTSPSTTHKALPTTQSTHPPTETSPSTTVTPTSTEEPHVPVHSSYFTTDALSKSSIIKLSGNETLSRLLFWPPSPNITVTLYISVAGQNYTFNSTTALPQHWHSIDIYQKTSKSNNTLIHLNTDGRYINLGSSRLLHIQVGSDNTTHWCFCPHAHLCTLLSPLEQGNSDSSGERTDLLVALLVVVFLLIVTLLALGGVTFYRKNELFHIYAKPIDCLPYSPQPPPLPSPNKEPARQSQNSEEAKQVGDEKTELTDCSGYSKVSGISDLPLPPTPLPTNTSHGKPQEQLKEHESINCLYGLV